MRECIGAYLARFPNLGGLPRYYGESTPAWTFSGPAQCSLPYSPHVALLPYYRELFLKCFRPFVASWPAPSTSGRSESGRVGISPTERVHLRQGTHNNAVENEIRPFSQGRRVWLFANNPLGARASANLFTLVSSARANGLEPYTYLNYVFEHLPAADTVEALEALLPWNARAALLPSQHPV